MVVEELEKDEYTAWKIQMEDRERARRIPSQHLVLEPSREVRTEIENIESELAEAGCLRECTKEDADINPE